MKIHFNNHPNKPNLYIPFKKEKGCFMFKAQYTCSVYIKNNNNKCKKYHYTHYYYIVSINGHFSNKTITRTLNKKEAHIWSNKMKIKVPGTYI